LLAKPAPYFTLALFDAERQNNALKTFRILMAVEFASREISEKYDRFARCYDWLEGIPDLLGIRRLRRSLLSRASGSVLEVAVGTGKNLVYYPHDCRLTAVDISRKMLNVARQRAAKLSMHVSFSLADAEVLPFADGCFDTVVSSLSTCTFPNPAGAFAEMARVCRMDGKILLLEHGRSDRDWLGRWQDRHADQFAKPVGCHWNREPLEFAKQAGLKVVKSRRSFFGVFHQIEAEPGSA
jgi:ubiquinone/menaquinone biosynthesis C-methylase UbiE